MQDEHILEDAYQKGMWAMDIQAESGISFSLKGKVVEKMSGLVQTEIDRNLWAVVSQEQSLVQNSEQR